MDAKVIKQSIISMLLGAGAVAAIVLLAGKANIHKSMPHGSTADVVFFSSLIIGPFIAIALHELGHLLAGLVQGFRFELYVVGPLGIKREGQRVKVYLNKDVGMYGGLAATVPTVRMPDIKRRFAWVVIAGPLTSLLVAAGCLAFFALGSNVFNGFWAITGLSSLGIFLGTTVPAKTGVFFTDRKRFQRLISPGASGAVELALLETLNQCVIDNSFKNISLEKVNVIKTDTDPFVQFWGCYYEYKHLNENKDPALFEDAREGLLGFKQQFPASIWKTLQLD